MRVFGQQELSDVYSVLPNSMCILSMTESVQRYAFHVFNSKRQVCDARVAHSISSS